MTSAIKRRHRPPASAPIVAAPALLLDREHEPAAVTALARVPRPPLPGARLVRDALVEQSDGEPVRELLAISLRPDGSGRRLLYRLVADRHERSWRLAEAPRPIGMDDGSMPRLAARMGAIPTRQRGRR